MGGIGDTPTEVEEPLWRRMGALRRHNVPAFITLCQMRSNSSFCRTRLGVPELSIGITFDPEATQVCTEENAYFIHAVLKKTGATGAPGLHAMQIIDVPPCLK